jgi:hypothetical protein
MMKAAIDNSSKETSSDSFQNRLKNIDIEREGLSKFKVKTQGETGYLVFERDGFGWKLTELQK